MTDINREKCSGVQGGIPFPDVQKAKPKMLLHSCCGPCSTAVIEKLIDEYDITVFFYNPCITDEKEYVKRKQAQLAVIEEFNSRSDFGGNIAFIEGKYEPKKYYKMIEGLEGEPEGGRRCSICFEMRLDVTAMTAGMHGFDAFTTTLTVSPHKNYDIISKIGKLMAAKYNVSYYDGNFKKQNGFKRSIELSKEMDLYRQNYCGCEFSVWEK